MLVLWEKIEFYKEKSNSFCSFESGAEPRWAFRGQRPKNFWFFNAFIKAIKELTRALIKLYSWLKKPYHFITNLFLLVDISTSDGV